MHGDFRLQTKLVRGFHYELWSKREFFPEGGRERPLQTCCISKEKKTKENTTGEMHITSVMTLERKQALMGSRTVSQEYIIALES